MKISEDMVSGFNQKLSNLNCCFRLNMDKTYMGDNTKCEVKLFSDKYIDSAILNLSEEFFNDLESYFKQYGVKLTFNNTGTIFWSESGWNE